MTESQEVVMFVPPKKLSECFHTNDKSKLEEMNVWCFTQEAAHNLLAHLQMFDPNLEIAPIKF